MKWPRKLEYALITLQYLKKKKQGELAPVKEVCETLNLPFDDTSRVMQAMAQGGLLKSEQGSRGGYLLVKDLSRVSFLDLSEMITGHLQVVKCLGDNRPCDLESHCTIKKPAQFFQNQLKKFYQKLSVKEILEEGSKDQRKAL